VRVWRRRKQWVVFAVRSGKFEGGKCEGGRKRTQKEKKNFSLVCPKLPARNQ